MDNLSEKFPNPRDQRVTQPQVIDEAEFLKLHAKYHERTYSYLLHLLQGAKSDAEDAQQETWLQAWKSKDQLKDGRAFRNWIFRIANHKAMDYFRKPGPDKELPLDELLDPCRSERSVSDSVSSLPDPHPSALDHLCLEQFVYSLPLPVRQLILLVDYEGFPQVEAAAILGLNRVTLRTRLHRARNELRCKLTGNSSRHKENT